MKTTLFHVLCSRLLSRQFTFKPIIHRVHIDGNSSQHTEAPAGTLLD